MGMILSIEINGIDQDLINFYEREENKSLVKDALIHGYKVVNSPVYALNFENSNQKSTEKIEELSQQNSGLSQQNQNYSQEILDLKTKQEFVIKENIQNLIQIHNQGKLEIQNSYSKKDTEKTILFQKELELSLGQKNQDIVQYKLQNNSLREQIMSIKNGEREHYEPIIEQLRDKLDERNSIYSNSSKKGAEGENEVDNILNTLFPTADITDTHSQSRSGDFRIELKGISILYENKNFTSNVPKRDIDKFIRDVKESDVQCGIMCSENTGIANKSDMEIEIIDSKPVIYLHNTKSYIDKIRLSVTILVNILQNNLELDVSMVQKVKELVKEAEEITKIYNSQKKNIASMNELNEKLIINNRSIKYRLEEIINKCETPEIDERKRKCQYCSKSFIDLEKHIENKHK